MFIVWLSFHGVEHRVDVVATSRGNAVQQIRDSAKYRGYNIDGVVRA